MDHFQWPRYDKGVQNALSEFCEGKDFSSWNLGNIYDEVPALYAAKAGAKFGIFCSSGTSGLHASLIAAGLQPGDEVIVPSMTFIRAVTPLIHLQLQPIVVDVDPLTGNIDPESIEKAISSKTKAVVVVHMWGIPADCSAIRAICDKNGLTMIEDFSHAHFSEFRKQPVGSFGDISFASMQRKKTISVGEGGIILTNNSTFFSRLKEITSPGSFPNTSDYSKIDFSGYGLNMRMSPFSAVVARALFPKIDEIVTGKEETGRLLLTLLNELLSDCIELPHVPKEVTRISWYSIKPVLKRGNMSGLRSLKLWKFSDFGYPAIATHTYWKKAKNTFPFCMQIQPKVVGTLMGQEQYLRNRFTLSIPTIGIPEWTTELKDEQRSELAFISEAIRKSARPR